MKNSIIIKRTKVFNEKNKVASPRKVRLTIFMNSLKTINVTTIFPETIDKYRSQHIAPKNKAQIILTIKPNI